MDDIDGSHSFELPNGETVGLHLKIRGCMIAEKHFTPQSTTSVDEIVILALRGNMTALRSLYVGAIAGFRSKKGERSPVPSDDEVAEILDAFEDPFAAVLHVVHAHKLAWPDRELGDSDPKDEDPDEGKTEAPASDGADS
ncbi:MAG: hypothetical protein AAF517_10285 [Planctomycetota bacterium]